MTNESQVNVERERLNEDARSNRAAILPLASSGALTVSTSTLLLKTVNLSNRPFARGVGITGIVVGAASFVWSLLSWRLASQAENKIRQMDHEVQNASARISNTIVNIGHVARLQQEQVSEISR